MAATFELLPPSGAPESIQTPRDVVRKLCRMFPKHTGEISEWADGYARTVGHLPPNRLAEVFAAVMDRWTRASPPKPADFAAAAPSPGSVQAGSADHGAFVAHGRIARAGFVEAKRIAARMIEDALRMCPEPLEAQEAWRLAFGLRDRAWLAAQQSVLGEAAETIEVTSADVARVRAGIIADTTQPDLVRFARANTLSRATGPEPSARMRERLASLARARDGEVAA